MHYPAHQDGIPPPLIPATYPRYEPIPTSYPRYEAYQPRNNTVLRGFSIPE